MRSTREHVAARVDDAVPRPAGERVQAAVAVADEVLRLGEELGVRAAAREDRHLVAARERGRHRVPAEECRSAEDEQPHSSASAPSSRSTSSAVL